MRRRRCRHQLVSLAILFIYTLEWLIISNVGLRQVAQIRRDFVHPRTASTSNTPFIRSLPGGVIRVPASSAIIRGRVAGSSIQRPGPKAKTKNYTFVLLPSVR